MQHKPQFNSILGINKDGKASGKHSFFPQRKPAVPTAPIAPGTHSLPVPQRIGRPVERVRNPIVDGAMPFVRRKA